MWEYSRIINEHAASMALQNHDVWLHMLFGRSTQAIKRVHCPGFHQFGFWHMVPFTQPSDGKRYGLDRNDGSKGSSALENVLPASRTIVSLHFCRDLAALERFHELVGAEQEDREEQEW